MGLGRGAAGPGTVKGALGGDSPIWSGSKVGPFGPYFRRPTTQAVIWPAVGSSRPITCLTSVVFPAPLGPSRP
jgi:hypothetical protein